MVQQYHEEIVPYAVELVQEVATTFLRLCCADPEDEDSAVAAGECIRTINVVVMSIASHQNLNDQLLPVLLPVVSRCMEESRVECFEDAMEMVTMLSYSISSYPIEMWQLLSHIHSCFDDFAHQFIDFLVGIIDNFVSRFPDIYLSPPTGRT